MTEIGDIVGMICLLVGVIIGYLVSMHLEKCRRRHWEPKTHKPCKPELPLPCDGKTRSLFLLKRREDYSQDPSYSSSYQIATGMYNSAKFVVDELVRAGCEAHLSIVIDGNDIDREVTRYKPTHVFIEGLWVTPDKLRELLAIPRHQTVTWHVRCHSEIPFVATEGVALEWIAEYLRLGVHVAPNSPNTNDQLRWLAGTMGLSCGLVDYLPNCYPVEDFWPILACENDTDTIDIACFGAYRPLKNHLQQAFVALRYAESIGKKLRFHINARYDQGGANPAKNVKALLEAAGGELVVHRWEDRETFLNTLSTMDLLLQISISETFNIVAADSILVGTPIVVSEQVPWVRSETADPHSVEDCLEAVEEVMSDPEFYVAEDRAGLKCYAAHSLNVWLAYLT